ncbi:ABC transporter substrate-binding protein [Alicyclobacillus sp. SP_1]|uniref:ABC transporter substrate-binding protein n=1 Tax=Alicyclobacillus sp. SP_1 TaxID=2942475 RepID=UPI0021573E32|nr:extracellular solute-binding protein [Alicyclobacillus sp. SP_1]
MKKVGKAVFASVSVCSMMGLLVGCGSTATTVSSNASNSTAVSTSAKTQLTLWSVDSGVAEKADQKLVSEYNSANPNAPITAEFFESTPYLQKLQIAMGAGQAASIFMNWGGGRLETFVTPGKVVNLTSQLNGDPAWKDKFLPSVMKSVTFNGQVYGVPFGNMQPVNFFYNKALFKKYNLTPPQTWNQLLSDIQIFKSHGIIPISLGGKDNWPDLMYFEYLVERIGGRQPYEEVAAGKPNSWDNPVILKALQDMKLLVKDGAFEPGFSSVGSNDGSDAALFYSGKAAMWLMGSWGYGSIMTSDSSFIPKLGYFAFPQVTGGKGNPTDVAGNPSDFYSIPTSATPAQQKAAINFLKNYNLDSKNVQNLLSIGYVPAIQGIESQLKQSNEANYEMFYYNLAKNASYFQQSWDTALPAAEGNQLDTDLGKFMIGQLSTSQFVSNMDSYLNK